MSAASVSVDRLTEWGGTDQAVRYGGYRIGSIRRDGNTWSARRLGDDNEWVSLGTHARRSEAVSAVVAAARL